MNLKKKLVIASLLMIVAASAHAQGETMGGFGFRSGAPLDTGLGFSASPTVGIRHWFSSQMGFDLGVGLLSASREVNGTKTDEATGFAFDLGLPISMKSWDKVNVIFRPGFAYGTAELKDKITPANDEKSTAYAVSGELEVEWMLAEKLSISAAHGIAYSSTKVEDSASPVNELKTSGFNTTGNNFTQLGFHVYLW